MSDISRERSKAWEMYPSSNPGEDRSSMNAICFGFVATAILVSMFLVMAIFEHLFKPTATHASLELGSFRKPRPVSPRYSSHLSVVMPGHRYPTCIAQPAPFPCPREGIRWPSHHHHHHF